MDKRIKTAWVLSIITMALIFCGQAYWLYNQYEYSSQINLDKAKKACADALEKELHIRYYEIKGQPESTGKAKKDVVKQVETMRQMVKISINREHPKDPKSGPRVDTRTEFILPGKTKHIYTKGLNLDDTQEMTNRYLASRGQRLDKKTLDSLLSVAGFGPTEDFRFYKTKHVTLKPKFSVTGTTHKKLDVTYSNNPLEFETLSFSIGVPAWQVLRNMAWQVAASVVLFIILCFCLAYQINTITIQKRIDGIRREFMKNMIYEMKQPPATEPAESEAVKIGNTDFYYSTNELRHGSDKVIITSRQAEILRLLAMHANETVSRETLLNEVWGDDSYANSMALNVQITYLRRALKADDSISIKSVIKKGYVLKG